MAHPEFDRTRIALIDAVLELRSKKSIFAQYEPLYQRQDFVTPDDASLLDPAYKAYEASENAKKGVHELSEKLFGLMDPALQLAVTKYGRKLVLMQDRRERKAIFFKATKKEFKASDNRPDDAPDEFTFDIESEPVN